MRDLLPTLTLLWSRARTIIAANAFISSKIKGEIFAPKNHLNLLITLLNILMIVLIITRGVQPAQRIASSVIMPLKPLHPIAEIRTQREVFGFAPFWTIDKLDGVDFNTLTTLAYFGVTVGGDGNLDRSDPGYQTFKSKKATEIFTKAHAHGTRVVLTLTQMNNGQILSLLDNPDAQSNAIRQATDEVQKRGIDGFNVDFEYDGDPGPIYRQKFTQFVDNLSQEIHRQNPNAKVTVSIYASSAKDTKIYDVSKLARVSDGIFVMAYDFATLSSDSAVPTAPLYGYKEGQYWYDVSTAVDDLLTQAPANKLILGVPWYGYNYLVYQPDVKSQTLPYYSWKGSPTVTTYADTQDKITPSQPDISDYRTGWDDVGKVGWKAYYQADTGTWRMVFTEDVKSLGMKYDFAKEKNLGGVGIWALGFDDGKNELWSLLRDKFGQKLADMSLVGKVVTSDENY